MNLASSDDQSSTYEQLVAEALAADFQGWDFGWLHDRTSGGELPWSYDEHARAAITRSASLLDIDTGGGEQLAGLAPLPPHAVAVEGWQPNVEVARQRLGPLGVDVRATMNGGPLPAADGEFDLVLNRHGSVDIGETARVLSAGGVFLSQQVDSRNDVEFYAALDAPQPDVVPHTVDTVVRELTEHRFRIADAREATVPYRYSDIGAVIYQLRAVSWTIADFDVDRYDERLRALDARIRSDGPFVTHNRRFIITAVKS